MSQNSRSGPVVRPLTLSVARPTGGAGLWPDEVLCPDIGVVCCVGLLLECCPRDGSYLLLSSGKGEEIELERYLTSFDRKSKLNLPNLENIVVRSHAPNRRPGTNLR